MSETTASAKAAETEKSGGKPRRSRGRRSVADPSFNLDELKELAALVDEHGFTDFEFENENIRVRLSKMTASPVVQAAPSYAAIQPAAPATPAPASTVPAETATSPQPDFDADLYKITSPIVGTFYRSPGPDKDSYVKEGSQVTPETVVCIVEAMKLMNEIQAETTGEVVKIYVENGQPVEYGQPLFGIKK
jgi:acetyl-CoA carboxylase biotin carboxyl carrier protein